MKITIFAFALLIAGIVSSFLITPVERAGGKKVDTAQIEFERYRIYDINESGVNGLLIATRGWHYADREVLQEPTVLRQDGEVDDGVSSDRGTIIGDELRLQKNVYYWDSLGRNLRTEEAVYNRKTGVLIGKGGFVLHTPQGSVRGANFAADTTLHTVQANEIKATINVKN